MDRADRSGAGVWTGRTGVGRGCGQVGPEWGGGVDRADRSWAGLWTGQTGVGRGVDRADRSRAGCGQGRPE